MGTARLRSAALLESVLRWTPNSCPMRTETTHALRVPSETKNRNTYFSNTSKEAPFWANLIRVQKSSIDLVQMRSHCALRSPALRMGRPLCRPSAMTGEIRPAPRALGSPTTPERTAGAHVEQGRPTHRGRAGRPRSRRGSPPRRRSSRRPSIHPVAFRETAQRADVGHGDGPVRMLQPTGFRETLQGRVHLLA